MMIFLGILTALSLWAVAAAVVAWHSDGYHRISTRPGAFYANEGVRKHHRRARG
jgi:hypothetical protein